MMTSDDVEDKIKGGGRKRFAFDGRWPDSNSCTVVPPVATSLVLSSKSSENIHVRRRQTDDATLVSRFLRPRVY
jgi:hypothetical protein